MPLENAKIRQERIEDALLDIDSIEINTNSPEEIGKSVMKAVEASLDILSNLSLNVRDIIMLLNRQNPDLLPVGPYPVAEPGAEVESGPEVEPGDVTGLTSDGQRENQ